MNYLARYILWNYSNVTDYKKFPFREVLNSQPASFFNDDPEEKRIVSDLLKGTNYVVKGARPIGSLDDLLISEGTTSFIITRDNSVVYEKYYNNSSRESVNTSFSISKSFTSALIGKAIEEGHIKSGSDPVTEYIPELKKRLSGNLTVMHLLGMSSGLHYDPKYYPWSDEPRSYYYPDIKQLILKSARQEYEPDQYFKYVNYNTIILGMILERATGMDPAEYLQEKIWKVIGMEYPASWSTDSRRTCFPKMESGINARSIDYAKFGKLYLNRGKWGDKQVLPASWVKESTCPPATRNDTYYTSKNYYPYSIFFRDRQLYYKYGWWGFSRDDGSYDFMALGIHGQFIYVCPDKQIVIVRNGKKWGKVAWWPALFRQISNSSFLQW